MATGAAEMMFRFVFDGCLAMQDMEVERRPYHRNCGCAPYNVKGVGSNTACSHTRNMSFPKKQTWTDCSLSMAAAASKFSSHFSRRGDSSVRNRSWEGVNGASSHV